MKGDTKISADRLTGKIFTREGTKMKSILERVEEGHPGETSLDTMNIMIYELGDLTKMLFYSKVYPERKKIQMIGAKIALSDLLAQCHVVCEREGWSFVELDLMGKERLHERIKRRLELGE